MSSLRNTAGASNKPNATRRSTRVPSSRKSIRTQATGSKIAGASVSDLSGVQVEYSTSKRPLLEEYSPPPPPKRRRQNNELVAPSKDSDDIPSPVKKSRGKGKAASDDSKPEKRGAIFKKKCPQTIMQRVERVMAQRFFMINRRRNEDELREEFNVLGSTGNCYTVVIGRTPSCSCPDAAKGNHCKHILFVFLKVLQVPQTSSHWYQKALLSSELEEIFSNAPAAPTSVIDPRISEAYARATGSEPSSSTSALGNKRLPGADDNCPICYEVMDATKEETLTFCATCGNALHLECFRQWKRSSTTSGKGLTCVWCRAAWPEASNSKGDVDSDGYLNLANAVGISQTRDTSTYHRPYMYQYYGRRNYDDLC